MHTNTAMVSIKSGNTPFPAIALLTHVHRARPQLLPNLDLHMSKHAYMHRHNNKGSKILLVTWMVEWVINNNILTALLCAVFMDSCMHVVKHVSMLHAYS